MSTFHSWVIANLICLSGLASSYNADCSGIVPNMTRHAPIEINVRQEDGMHIFDVHGRLTIGDSSDQLTAALNSILENGARKVVIDLNGVPQIDSSGISSLVRMSVSLGRQGGVLHLVCLPGRVRDALTVTRLVEAIPTFDTLAAASKFA